MNMECFSKGILFFSLAYTMLNMPGPPPESLISRAVGTALMLACWVMGAGYMIASWPEIKE